MAEHTSARSTRLGAWLICLVAVRWARHSTLCLQRSLPACFKACCSPAKDSLLLREQLEQAKVMHPELYQHKTCRRFTTDLAHAHITVQCRMPTFRSSSKHRTVGHVRARGAAPTADFAQSKPQRAAHLSRLKGDSSEGSRLAERMPLHKTKSIVFCLDVCTSVGATLRTKLREAINAHPAMTFSSELIV